MLTIKKKDFKNIIKESKHIKEFVNDDGSKISGDERFNMGVDIKTGPINTYGDDKGISPTTDDYAANAIQPRNWWWSLTYGYTQSNGQGASAIPSNNLDEDITEMLSGKSNDKDFIKRGIDNDINRNNIPDLEELSDTKMIITSKMKDLIDTINVSNLTGDEIAIVLNNLISNIDTKEMSNNYKQIISKQL